MGKGVKVREQGARTGARGGGDGGKNVRESGHGDVETGGWKHGDAVTRGHHISRQLKEQETTAAVTRKLQQRTTTT